MGAAASQGFNGTTFVEQAVCCRRGTNKLPKGNRTSSLDTLQALEEEERSPIGTRRSHEDGNSDLDLMDFDDSVQTSTTSGGKKVTFKDPQRSPVLAPSAAQPTSQPSGLQSFTSLGSTSSPPGAKTDNLLPSSSNGRGRGGEGREPREPSPSRLNGMLGERLDGGGERRSRREDGREHGSSSRGKEKKERVPRMDESNKEVVAQLRELATRIEGRCTKYPTSGGGLLGIARERYVAVLPFDDIEGQVSFRDQTQGLEWRKQLGLWRRSKLGYWVSQENFKREEDPKGGIAIMSISKVEWDPVTPFDVSVRHKDKETNTTQELTLQFPSEGRAKEWRETLHTIRALLQDTVVRSRA